MGDLFRLDTRLVSSLADETIDLIHYTRTIGAIKLLVSSHEILSLNLELLRLFSHPTWDKAALNDLGLKRNELILKFIYDFQSPKLLMSWANKVTELQKVTA